MTTTPSTQDYCDTASDYVSLDDPRRKAAQKAFLQAWRLQGTDSWRPLDWRWKRAVRIFEGSGWVPAKGGDEHVERAIAFLQADGESCDPSIRQALELHQRDDIRTWELQAWLLTREPVTIIAEETGLPSETIAAYSRFFFDLDRRLDARSFVVHQVIGPKIHYGLNPQDVGVIWRHYAYWLGPHVLRALLADFREAGRCDYGYLFDGSQKLQELSLDRLYLHQAIRALLLTPQDMRRLLYMLISLPHITAHAQLSDALYDLLAVPELWRGDGPTDGLRPQDSQAA
jgi:hypothetical protein